MCGITAFYPKKGKTPNIDILKAISSLNDTRGGDNSGISIGNDYFKKSDIHRLIIQLWNAEKTNISKIDSAGKPWILHTRSSSNKTKLLERHAHPFKWEDKSSGYYYIGCHNGYISNTDEIYKKFIQEHRNNEKDTSEVDSETLLDAILCNSESEDKIKEILKFYRGNAALVIYDNTQFRVWKGASSNKEERPLYYAETKEGWYFSSLEYSLKLYFDKVEMVPHNTMLIFENHKLKDQYTVERIDPVIVHTPPAYYYNRMTGQYEFPNYGNENKYNPHSNSAKLSQFVEFNDNFRVADKYGKKDIIHGERYTPSIINCYNIYYSNSVSNDRKKYYIAKGILARENHYLFNKAIIESTKVDSDFKLGKFLDTYTKIITKVGLGVFPIVVEGVIKYLLYFNSENKLTVLKQGSSIMLRIFGGNYSIFNDHNGKISYKIIYNYNSANNPNTYDNTVLNINSLTSDLDLQTASRNSYQYEDQDYGYNKYDYYE